MITNSKWSFQYCINVNDIKEISNQIIEEPFVRLYKSYKEDKNMILRNYSERDELTLTITNNLMIYGCIFYNTLEIISLNNNLQIDVVGCMFYGGTLIIR